MSKFFTASQIAKSITSLADVHLFYGITFLTCKLNKLPIGETINFALDTKTDAFLREHHLIDPASEWFFQPFKSSDNHKKWVRPDYAAKGLQRVNTGTFGKAFIYESNSRIGGWSTNYVQFLASKLVKKKKIPAFDLAVWLFRTKEWPDTVTPENIIATFFSTFSISKEEQKSLFGDSMPNLTSDSDTFGNVVCTWAELRPLLPAAPDSQPEQGGTLAYIETTGLGPAEKFTLNPADRLTLITGDNGLGKTFLLECCWWALTGTWAGRPALSNSGNAGGKTSITFAINSEAVRTEPTTISFDWKTLSWPIKENRPTISGLIVYARVDGSFAVWDPAKQGIYHTEQKAVFSSTEVWDGLPGRIEGLIRDWVRWQNNPTKSPFDIFTTVLAQLSPPDLGILEPGEPIRVPGDPRDIPTIKHPYGATPIISASAGVRRVVTLAYLIVWAWTEHIVASKLAGRAIQRRMVVLVDEMEAHLHPKWQRAFLPALMSIQETLSSELEAQYIVATHSPLVMASAETVFNTATDSLVHLDLAPNGDVTLKEIDFIKYGDVSSWLTSPVFDLRHARSTEAEKAIEKAKTLQSSPDVAIEAVRSISDRKNNCNIATK